MMPTIRVSDTNWQRLKSHARPLEDTADDVVGRALDALEGKKGEAPQTNSNVTHLRIVPKHIEKDGRKLPQRAFRMPLLLVLHELGGEAPAHKIRKAVEKKVASRLNPADYKKVTSGDARWWNAVCWERNSLVKEGYLRSDSERGIWALDEKGRIAVIIHQLKKKKKKEGSKQA